MLLSSPPPQLSASRSRLSSPGFPLTCIEDQSLLVDRALMTLPLWNGYSYSAHRNLRHFSDPLHSPEFAGSMRVTSQPLASLCFLCCIFPVSHPFHSLSFTDAPVLTPLCPSTPTSISARLPFPNMHQSRTIVLFVLWTFSLGAPLPQQEPLVSGSLERSGGKLQVYSPPLHFV